MVVTEKSNLPDHLCRPEGFIGELVAYMDETSEYSNPEFYLAAALCLLSVISGRKVEDYRGTRTNIFAVSIGPTGGGKEHARKVLKKLLKDTLLEGPEKFTAETAIVTALQQSPALLQQCDEIGLFLKASCNERSPPHMQSVISAMMTIFTSSDSFWQPKGFARAEYTKGVEQPHLVLHGTTTGEMLFDALTGSHVTSGFIGRLMLFMSPECDYVPMQDYEYKPIPAKIKEFIEAWIAKPYSDGNVATSFKHETIPTMEILADARERIKEHFRAISDRRKDEDKTTAAIWSRASEKTSKLAMLHTISKGENCTSLESAEWAIAVSNFLTRRLVALVSNNVADSEHEKRVQKMLKIVKKEGIISLTDFGRKTQWLTLRDRNDIAQQLVESGTLLSVYRESATRPAAGYTADYSMLKGTDWVLMTPEIRERLKKGDVSK